MLGTIIGNSALKKDLIGALSASSLTHAVILCGEEGTGTGYAAACLAADYLYKDDAHSARMLMEGHSAELICVQGEGASGDIRIDAVRNMREAIFATSLSCKGRCVIVYKADHLNAFSANALLKTLEDPPRDTLFILTAPSAAAMLPTIRSRCAVYNMSPVSEDECCEYLNKHYPSVKDAKELSAIYGGRIGLCLKVAQDANARAGLDNALRLAESCAKADEYSALTILASCEKDRALAASLFANLRTICSAVLRGHDIHKMPRERAARVLAALYNADILLAGNVNAKLIYTQAAAKLTAV